MEEFKLEEKYVETPHGKIVYFSRSISKDKPTVVFLHGLSSNHSTWLHAMEKLSQNGLGSIALDLRGHGFSDMQKKRKLYNLGNMKEDLKLILEKEELNSVHLVG